MKKSLKLLLVSVLISFITYSSHAQPRGMGAGPMGGGMGGMDAVITKFFGEVKGFTAQADMTVEGQGDKISMTTEFALLEDKMRTEMDMTTMKSAKMPAGMGAQMKQMGMDKMCTIVDAKAKTLLIIYPGLKAYVETPLPKDQAELAGSEPKIEKTELGKETVDGHPCKKCKVVVADDKGNKRDAFIWAATDLKDFPIKIQTTTEGMNVTILYKNVKMEKPDAKLFSPPSDCTKYDNFQSMMQGAMMKMLSNPQR